MKKLFILAALVFVKLSFAGSICLITPSFNENIKTLVRNHLNNPGNTLSQSLDTLRSSYEKKGTLLRDTANEPAHWRNFLFSEVSEANASTKTFKNSCTFLVSLPFTLRDENKHQVGGIEASFNVLVTVNSHDATAIFKQASIEAVR